MSNRVVGKLALLLCLLSVTIDRAHAGDVEPPLKAVVVASGLDKPLFVTAPPGDMERVFVLEKPGRIRTIENDQVLEEPFLDITGPVDDAGFEQGLLGLAFHPDYADNGYFYVNYTANDLPLDRTIISRFQVTQDPNVADPASESLILTFSQPFSNHNGGMMAFGPNDDYLYISTGDGGSFNDPFGNGQSLTTLLGKLLRIDVDSAAPYAIPSSNPFATEQKGVQFRKEIWAYGLRNPWRFSFDHDTGDIYIGDVGQGSREEVDFQPASSNGGENYGWDIAEGFACLGGSGSCGTQEGFTPPIFDYRRTEGQAVTGGYVYRGQALPELQGVYFFGDYSQNRIWSFRYDGAVISEFQERTDELLDDDQTIAGLSSFGEDGAGELYFTSIDSGDVFKIVSDDPLGDVNNDGTVDAQDIQLVINAVLTGSGALDAVDINRDEVLDAVDVQLVINSALGIA